MLERSNIENNSGLTTKQKRFCQEYIVDWNATRAAIVAGYSKKTAKEIGYENLTKPYIKAFIEEIKLKIEEQSGISALRILLEWKKIAFCSISELHETWVSRKDFDAIEHDHKACIQEISTKVRTETIYSPSNDKKEPVEIEYVKIKLFDKAKALENISKMLGYNTPESINHKVEQSMPFNITINRRKS